METTKTYLTSVGTFLGKELAPLKASIDDLAARVEAVQAKLS